MLRNRFHCSVFSESSVTVKGSPPHMGLTPCPSEGTDGDISVPPSGLGLETGERRQLLSGRGVVVPGGTLLTAVTHSAPGPWGQGALAFGALQGSIKISWGLRRRTRISDVKTLSY